MLDGKPEPVKFVCKRESRLHRIIAKLPRMSKSYMPRYWTTIGSTIYVPEYAEPLNGHFTSNWKVSHLMMIRHEARHARRARKLTLPLYATLYLGPSVTLGPIVMLLTVILGACGLGWSPLLWVTMLVLGLLPLSVGFAVFRAWDEIDAYREYVAIDPDKRIPAVAKVLWTDYLAVPPFVSRWFMSSFGKYSKSK